MIATQPDLEQQRQLLIRSWMTHDAMWFVAAVQELGIERANTLNLRAVRSMAVIEVRRLRKLLGLREISSLQDVRDFFDGALEVVMGDFMDFELQWTETADAFTVRFERCFAYEGVQRIGVVDNYHCGIFPRLDAWLDALAVGWTVEPAAQILCAMHQHGSCERTYRLHLDAPNHGPKAL